MNVSAMTIFIWFVFPLCAEILFAYAFQEIMGWDRMDRQERALFIGIFLCITFPVLILPSMGIISLFANLFLSF